MGDVLLIILTKKVLLYRRHPLHDAGDTSAVHYHCQMFYNVKSRLYDLLTPDFLFAKPDFYHTLTREFSVTCITFNGWPRAGLHV